MKTFWMPEAILYDGSQLRAHWILGATGLVGDALVGFRGPCDVADAEIADLEDVGGPGIRGSDMVHFLMEIFDDGDLERAVLRQRLLTVVAGEVLRGQARRSFELRREGDDLFVGERKLSISVATRSLVSTLTHLAINVDPRGAPVAAIGLVDLEVEAEEFAKGVLDAMASEHAAIREARCKVRGRGDLPA